MIKMLYIGREQLNALMAQKGYKKDVDLAMAANISRITLSKCINKMQKPGSRIIEKLCATLNCQPGAFLRYEPDDPPEEDRPALDAAA